MKFSLLLALYLTLSNIGLCQNGDRQMNPDSLLTALQTMDSDTVRIDVLIEIANYYRANRPDSSIYYANKALEKSIKSGYKKGELRATRVLARAQHALGNESKSLRINLRGLKKAYEYNDTLEIAVFQLRNGVQYHEIDDLENALDALLKALDLFERINHGGFIAITKAWLGNTYLHKNQMDIALQYCQEALFNSITMKESNQGARLANEFIGKIYSKQGHSDSAMFYFKRALVKSIDVEDIQSRDAVNLAKEFLKQGRADSALLYGNIAYQIAIEQGAFKAAREASIFMAELSQQTNASASIEYYKNAIAYEDSLKKLIELSSYGDILDYDEQQKNVELSLAESRYQSQLRTNAFLGSTFTLLVIVFLVYRNNHQKQRSKKKVEIAYERLQNTQTQLIHSEKMASLGELTAGIAHEIQNPLNFVNNFSEVNKEMLAELREAVASNDQEEIAAILKDLEDNEDKVTHHGKRAEQIVKSMLQHSRTGSGEKEITDINALCDEYLRLSYHGYRAKDKSFQSDFKLDLDPDLPKVNVVPQDIGRVLLNLINNAFQAVYADVSAVDSSKAEASAKASGDYKPLVSVITKLDNHQIIISVKDNGPGIPDDIKDKIFQPFFTTKPTGEGTGLGLSMSYDIVTKGHGGALEVESSSTRGSSFVIKLYHQ